MIELFEQVENEYKNKFEELDDKKFHFASRLFLWKNDQFSKEKLIDLKDHYLGCNESECEEKLKHILQGNDNFSKSLFKKEREEYFIKYPMLKKYTKILFKYLFAKTIYNLDLGPIIKKLISEKELLDLRDSLFADKKAVAMLSTNAINYFYCLNYFLDPDAPIDASYFLSIAENEPCFDDEKLCSLQIYLLTHCVIGETVFYSRKISNNIDIYKKMISVVEKQIENHYELVSLDNKFEFLVCASMCGVKSHLKEKIYTEANECYDIERGYICEKIAGVEYKGNLKSSEHRNVLAVMSTTEYGRL